MPTPAITRQIPAIRPAVTGSSSTVMARVAATAGSSSVTASTTPAVDAESGRLRPRVAVAHGTVSLLGSENGASFMVRAFADGVRTGGASPASGSAARCVRARRTGP